MVTTTTEAKIKGRNEEWNKQKTNIYDDRKTTTMNRRKSYTRSAIHFSVMNKHTGFISRTNGTEC